MSFGWSAGDIVSLAKLSYEVYHFCATAPAELRNTLTRFERIGQKLEGLAAVLENSGLGSWKIDPALRESLEAAKRDLEPLRYAADKNQSFSMRAKGVAHLAITQDKLKRINLDIDINERAINDIKIDIILACSLKNLQAGRGSVPSSVTSAPVTVAQGTSDLLDANTPITAILLPAPHGLRSIMSAPPVAISNARQALTIARDVRARRSNGNRELRGERADDPTDDFVSEIVSIAEGLSLYAMNPDLLDNLEGLNEITAIADNFEQRSFASSSGSTISGAQTGFSSMGNAGPDQCDTDIFGDVSFETDIFNRAIRPSSHRHRSQSAISSSPSVGRDTPIVDSAIKPSSNRSSCHDPLMSANRSHSTYNPSTSPGAEYVSRTTNGREVSLAGKAMTSLTTRTEDAQECFFVSHVSEGSLLLTVTCSNGGFNAGFERNSSSPCRSLCHCLSADTRPIPHLLHPIVEGPVEEPAAPYTITFTEPQYVSYEDATQNPQWMTSLKYIFFEKQDRNRMCSLMFGKRLLMMLGVNRVTLDGKGVSTMSALALWQEETSGVCSITFTPNLTDNRSKDIELKVTGLWNANKGKSKGTTGSVTLAADLVQAHHIETMLGTPSADSERRKSSVSSAGSFFRRFSSASSEDAKPLTRRKCTIHFSNPGDMAAFVQQIPD